MNNHIMVTGAQLVAWLNNQTGFAPLELEPIETREQRNARLIATANRQPLPADLVPVIAARLTN
ncbi:MAG: hypothetical protein B7Z31_00085 [Rhodobacterales bacterium 12-65-15]|nr:MAG: hypothetical protein B7Z31_00085 [Rhodobacterales bacterium 12-65-15]